MKKLLNNNRMGCIVFIVLLMLMPAGIFAEALWAVNASVNADEFSNFPRDLPLLGASNTFPANTRIKVTNPGNNKSVEITIVKRSPRPGGGLVLSPQAALALGIPEGSLVSVQLQLAESSKISHYDAFYSSDPDINPGLTVPERVEANADANTEANADANKGSPSAEDSGIAGSTLAGAVSPESPTETYYEAPPPSIPQDSLMAGRTDELSPGNPEARDTAGLEEGAESDLDREAGEGIALQSDPAPSPGDLQPAPDGIIDMRMQDELHDDSLPRGGNVIYFFTPGDFRPPAVQGKGKEGEEIVPVLVNRSILKDYIVNKLNNGSSYIQLGAYSSPETVYSVINAIDLPYPMAVWTDYRGDQEIYKLLIGPLTKDETGVLTYRFRSRGYSDLFLYHP